MKICTKCQKEYDDSLEFCIQCGAKLTHKLYNTSTYNEQRNDTASSTKESKWKVAFGIAVACLLFFVAYSFTPSSNKNITTTPKKVEASVKSYPGWSTVKIPNEGSMQIPPTMEVQNDAYRLKSDISHETQKQVDSGAVIVQQKGLNNATKEAFSRYARVMINTVHVSDLPKLNEKLNLSQKEISDFGEEIKNAIITNESKMPGHKFLKWGKPEIRHINGVDCFYLNYNRQFKNNPVVNCEKYIFFNHDRVHHLTISYRLNAADYWTQKGKNIQDVVKTVKFIAR